MNRFIVCFVILMIACAATLNAVMDKLQFHYGSSVFARFESHQQWLDPSQSWRNKWKHGDPAQGEAFPLSSTAMVAVTDAWHFFKSLWLSCVVLAVLAPCTALVRLRWWGWVLVFMAVRAAYGTVFEVMFAHVLAR